MTAACEYFIKAFGVPEEMTNRLNLREVEIQCFFGEASSKGRELLSITPIASAPDGGTQNLFLALRRQLPALPNT